MSSCPMTNQNPDLILCIANEINTAVALSFQIVSNPLNDYTKDAAINR
jgi:hypothetical protein